MEKHIFNELLAINKVDQLKLKGISEVTVIYRQTFRKRILSYFIPELKDTANFSLDYWVIFKESIITNLYNKNLCKIVFKNGKK